MKYQLSIIIPVLNETGTINHTLEHLNTLSFAGGFEVIVVDGDPAGQTVNAISYPAGTRMNVKKTVAAKGRGSQMNRGASIAGGSILLFLHADTTIGQEELNQIPLAFRQKGVVAGAFDLGIQSDRKIFRIIETTASIRSRITRIPYGDQAIFVKKSYFHQINGFAQIPIMEDVEIMRRIKKSGGKIRILSSRVLTSPRRWEKEGILYCTFRNWTLITLYLMGCSPKKLAKFYR